MSAEYLLERHVLSSGPALVDSGKDTFAWTPGLAGERAARLKNEVPWGVATAGADQPPRLEGRGVLSEDNYLRLHFAWIDGREGKKEPGTFVARSTDQGRTVTKNFKVDDNTCVCCRTSIATSPDGLVYVAWRKIFDGNIRETVVARSADGGMTFSAPVVVGNDRWVYQACPHRPASLGVDRMGRLYVVWYTEGADETPAIYLAYSDDQGKTFSEKKQLNRSKGTFPDHPQMAVDPHGRVMVIWEEQSPVRREIVMRHSRDRGNSFSQPQKLNEKHGQTPTIGVNQQGTVVMGWKEHAMPAHRLVVQTMQLPGVSVAEVEIRTNGP